jgi:Restriction endonuclease
LSFAGANGFRYSGAVACEIRRAGIFRQASFDCLRVRGEDGVHPRVEAKACDQPVDKDALLKLTQIVDDLGADRGVLATTSYFTPGALKMAEGRNVDLWDRDRVSRLLGEAALGLADDGAEAPAAAASDTGLLGVIPRVSMPEARAAVEAGVARRRKGGLLGALRRPSLGAVPQPPNGPNPESNPALGAASRPRSSVSTNRPSGAEPEGDSKNEVTHC